MATAGVKRSAQAAGLDDSAAEAPKAARMEDDVEGAAELQQADSSVAPSATSPSAQIEAANDAADEQRIRSELQAQLAALENDRVAILAGNHPSLAERHAVLDSVRAESVARAVSQKQLQLENVEKQFEYACYAAERICEGSKREATASLLKEVQDRQAELAARISGQAEPKESRTQRTTRSKRKGDDGVVGGPGTTADAKKAEAALANGVMPVFEGIPPFAVALPAPDALSDMKVVYRDWKAAAHKWRPVAAANLMPTRVEKGKLYYGQDSFAKNEGVVVFSELSREEFYGSVYMLSKSEVFVRLTDGTKVNIPLHHLRHGRVSLYRQPALSIPTALESAGLVPADSMEGRGGGYGGGGGGGGGAGMPVAAAMAAQRRRDGYGDPAGRQRVGGGPFTGRGDGTGAASAYDEDAAAIGQSVRQARGVERVGSQQPAAQLAVSGARPGLGAMLGVTGAAGTPGRTGGHAGSPPAAVQHWAAAAAAAAAAANVGNDGKGDGGGAGEGGGLSASASPANAASAAAAAAAEAQRRLLANPNFSALALQPGLLASPAQLQLALQMQAASLQAMLRGTAVDPAILAAGLAAAAPLQLPTSPQGASGAVQTTSPSSAAISAPAPGSVAASAVAPAAAAAAPAAAES